MGLEFPNKVGLAAGFDKNAEYIDVLARLGFGFIEIGTITPRPQPGNPEPRLFRLPKVEALINRMGFNNKGVDQVVKNIRRSKYKGILGISIGKNSSTPLEKAVDDYVYSLQRIYEYADYVAINISSPGTKDLRKLQQSNYLVDMLSRLKTEQEELKKEHGKYVPLVIKIAPDLTDHELTEMAGILLAQKIDGIIATNTTLSREGLNGIPDSSEEGGLSGKPLRENALGVLKTITRLVGEKIPVIASGGIMTADDAMARINAGAPLVQIYTGFIYHGPKIINEIGKRIEKTG
jgi:dihydroorotate dehydrogenase